MPNTVLVGAQWGDEGKGKVIDVLSEDVDLVVRYQGGNNAGHTVEIGDDRYILHLIPSGILHEGKACVIGNGVVVNPLVLKQEIEGLHKQGISTEGRLFISDRAHVILPYHCQMDAFKEEADDGDVKIGTTKRGIGPSYSDKASRLGLRMGDLMDADATDLLVERIEQKNKEIIRMGGTPQDAARMKADVLGAAEFLRNYVVDTVTMLNDAISSGKNCLFEGAQGTMLDIDFGTYPFVTSSNSTSGGASTGAGVPPHCIDRVIGVIKAYTTRVGEGPFPTELMDDTGAHIAKVGHEFGATTGRPRRCGWFDVVVARYAAMVSGIDSWAMTKLDVLDDLDELQICTAYELDGKSIQTMPSSVRQLARCKPIYESMPGWKTPTRDISKYEDLPENARAYVERLCELTGVPLGILSVGPNRSSTMRITL
jgi:adenylosuccinate synthase